MRIIIIHTYSVNEGSEARHFEKLYRDRMFGRLLQRSDPTIEVRGLVPTTAQGAVRFEDGDNIIWDFVPVDVRDLTKERARQGSASMVEAALSWKPDVIFIKGSGSKSARKLRKSFSGPVATVIGGKYEGREIAESELVLTETDEQDHFLRTRLGSKRVLRLPKLVHPTFGPKDSVTKTDYDVAVVSNFLPWKNHASLEPLLNYPVSIAFVGDGPLMPLFQRRFASRVATTEFLGALSIERVADVLKRSRILVHPSLSEGFPRAVAEAMATGIPVVALQGVVEEPLVNEFNGLLVEKDQVTSATNSLLSNPGILHKLGDAALATARQEFTIDNLSGAVRDIIDILPKILKRYRLTGRRDRVVRQVRYGVQEPIRFYNSVKSRCARTWGRQ